MLLYHLLTQHPMSEKQIILSELYALQERVKKNNKTDEYLDELVKDLEIDIQDTELIPLI